MMTRPCAVIPVALEPLAILRRLSDRQSRPENVMKDSYLRMAAGMTIGVGIGAILGKALENAAIGVVIGIAVGAAAGYASSS